MALVNVGIGNIDSVTAVLHYLGTDFVMASSAGDLAGASHVLLPGVGAYRAGMSALERHGMVEPLRQLARHGNARLLGICLGMQLLGTYSEEGDCEGLGIMPFDVRRIEQPAAGAIKVPHVGFTKVSGYRPVGLFAGLGESADFYFTHSFAVRESPGDANVGSVRYGRSFVAAFDSGRVCGAQFHPEKSQSNGLRMLRNFLE